MNNPHNYDYETRGEISYLYLYQRNDNKHIVTIDTFNLEKVLCYKYRWHVCYDRDAKDFYVRATEYLGVDSKGKLKNRPIVLHVFLCGNPENVIIDHKNRNTLDDRMENFRHTSIRNNTRNRKGKNSNNTSGHRNVSWIGGCWRVQLQISGKNHMFKEKFTDVDEAGTFAEEMRQKYYGEFAGMGR